MLTGRGPIPIANGEVFELKPGTAVRPRAGDRTRSTITEKFRKFYAILPSTIPTEKQ